jgi:cytochrome P450
MSIPAHEIIELKVHLPPDASEKLRQRAAASGKGIADYASELIEDAVTKPGIDEVLAPVRAQFARSGMTEDELSDFLEEAKHRRRAERRKVAGE